MKRLVLAKVLLLGLAAVGIALGAEPREAKLSGASAAAPAKAKPVQAAPAKAVKGEVVVYASLDQIFSEPLLERFEKKTGLKVKAVYDAEAVKTAGLVNRLLSEQAHPRCDVFWNNEIIRTLLMKRRGVTQPYRSPEGAAFPASMRDPEGHWTGFAARARVVIYNTKLVKPGEAPSRFASFGALPSFLPSSLPAAERWKGRFAIANPLFGTTATEAAVVWSLWGPERFQKFYESMKQNQVVVAAGNSMTRDQAASGELPWALTDSDDANGAMLDGKPVAVNFIEYDDPATSSSGILLIPNTVSLIANCPHPEAGKMLIDYLLSAEVEVELAKGRSAQLPLRPGLAPPKGWEDMARRRPLAVKWDKVLDALEPSAKWLDRNFVR